MDNKVTYYIGYKPVAVTTTIENKVHVELIGIYKHLLLFTPNDIELENNSKEYTGIQTVSDLKKIIYGKDTFVMKG